MRALVCAAALISLMISARVGVAGESDHPARLLLVLGVPDQSPSRAQLIEVGSGPEGSALLAVALDETLPRYTRMRAAGSLVLFTAPSSLAALATIAGDGTRPGVRDPEVRIQAISAFASRQGAESVPALRRWLSDPDSSVRAVVVRALGRVGTADALAAVRSIAVRDPAREVRAAAGRVLAPSPRAR